jgi:hypothetical protein
MYYYIVVDKVGKTLEIFPAKSCEAATEKAYAKARLNIELSGIQSIQFCNRFKAFTRELSTVERLRNTAEAMHNKGITVIECVIE